MLSLGCSRDHKQLLGFDRNRPLTNARMFCIAMDPVNHVDPKRAREERLKSKGRGQGTQGRELQNFGDEVISRDRRTYGYLRIDSRCSTLVSPSKTGLGGHRVNGTRGPTPIR